MGWNVKSAFKHIVNPVSWIQDTYDAMKDIGEHVAQYGKDIRDHDDHVAQRQNEAQKRAIDEQNAYNTPANQIQRLLDAGLNPNLAYGLVDTGNQKTTANYAVGNKSNGILGAINTVGGLLGHAFNAVQLMNSIQMRKQQQASQLFQEQYQKDVLDLRKHELAVNEAFREKEMAYRQSRDAFERDKWQKEFDERVSYNSNRLNEQSRHNKAMEGKPTTMSMLDSITYGATGKHTTDILGEAGRLEKKYIENVIKYSPFGQLAKLHAKYF